MKQILPDVWQTAIENPAPGLYTHAYLLVRQAGNVLFYNTGHAGEIEQMEALGGVALHYLSHLDELGDTLKLVRERYGARLGGPVRELEAFSAFVPPDILFEEREMRDGNIEVIPVPGHTAGSTCFLVHGAAEGDYLFVGDTLYLNDDRQWAAGYIPGYSDHGLLMESLVLLQSLEPDVVIGSGFSGVESWQRMKAGDWRRYVGRALADLQGKRA